MSELDIGERDVLRFLRPDTLLGALVYLVLFVLLAMLASRALRTAVHASMTRSGYIDRTTISFLQQFGSALIWVMLLILYAHLIPVLRSMGTALLAGASVASVVIGLAAQSTLGNLVAGVSITIYRPFRLGDTLQVGCAHGDRSRRRRVDFAGVHDTAGPGRAFDRLAEQRRRESGDHQPEFDVCAVAARSSRFAWHAMRMWKLRASWLSASRARLPARRMSSADS